MTVSTDTTTTTCPAWCTRTGCDNGGTEFHGSGPRTIGLSHAEPERFDHPMDGQPAWEASELDVSLWQAHGAAWPTILLDGPDGANLTLDMGEAQELVYALIDLIEKGTGRNITPGFPEAT